MTIDINSPPWNTSPAQQTFHGEERCIDRLNRIYAIFREMRDPAEAVAAIRWLMANYSVE